MLKDAQEMKNEVFLNENTRLGYEFKALLEKHYKEEFNVDYYSNMLKVPLKTLSKLSHEVYKKSPKAVINDRRILEIKRQLKGTSKSRVTRLFCVNAN
jgi:AraC-like DNA-binding protein